MQFNFCKYQGTGNDFILVDNREEFFPKSDTRLIQHLCDRRFGIGADGLILLENENAADFKMVYFNADGNLGSMCGNGGRCIVAFAKSLEIIQSSTAFTASDGLHYATIHDDEMVSLQMKDVDSVKIYPEYVFLDTGSPHHIQFEDHLAHLDVKTKGCSIRNSILYEAAGSNVNFVEQLGDSSFSIRTYERGVEDETLSCGTGATAVAIAMHAIGKTQANKVTITVAGGKLSVSFSKKAELYSNIKLKGPATFVFKGSAICRH